MKLLIVLVLIVVFVAVYWLRSPINGYWEASPEFLKKSGLKFMSVMFKDPYLILLMKADKTIVEIYKFDYERDGDEYVMNAHIQGKDQGAFTDDMKVSIIDKSMLITKNETVLASLIRA